MPQLVDAVEESVDRARRLYEIHFLIWFPFMSAISLFDDFYRDVLGSVSDFDSYRLLQGFENMTVASGRALWQLSRQALQAGSVRVIAGAGTCRWRHCGTGRVARRTTIPGSAARVPRGMGPAR